MGDWPPWFPSTNDRMLLTIFSEVDNTYADIVTTTPTTRASTITTRTPGQCVSSPIPFLESSQQLCLIFRWPVPPVTSVDNILVALRIHQQLLFLSILLNILLLLCGCPFMLHYPQRMTLAFGSALNFCGWHICGIAYVDTSLITTLTTTTPMTISKPGLKFKFCEFSQPYPLVLLTLLKVLLVCGCLSANILLLCGWLSTVTLPQRMTLTWLHARDVACADTAATTFTTRAMTTTIEPGQYFRRFKFCEFSQQDRHLIHWFHHYRILYIKSYCLSTQEHELSPSYLYILQSVTRGAPGLV